MPAGTPRPPGGRVLTLLGLVAAAFVLAACADSPAGPPSGAGAGLIAYVAGSDGNFEIYVIAADGSGRRRLTDDPAEDLFPSWSPDGRLIAFASDRDGDFDIFVMDAGGGGLRRLTYEAAQDTDPCWAPDGKALAFRSDREGETAIYILELEMMTVRRVTPAGLAVLATNIDWSRDGRIVFAAQPDDDLGIYSILADGSGLRRMTGSTRRQGLLDPAWSPDGRRIAYTSLRDGDLEVYTVGADGEGHRRLTARPGLDAGPAWSPDGTRIAFVSDRSGARELYTMAADGSDVRLLTQGDGAQQPSWR